MIIGVGENARKEFRSADFYTRKGYVGRLDENYHKSFDVKLEGLSCE
jgi:hypothetical protein